MNTGRTWGKDDYFICGCPLPVVSKGIWSGDNPLNCIFPVLILQLIMGIFLSKVVYFILRPLRQSKCICSVLGGILLGPSFIGVNGKIREVLFPPNETGVFNTFATIGTILPWVTVLSLFYTQLNYLPAGLHPKSSKQTNLEQAIETCVSSTIVVLFTIYAIRPALISVIKRTPEGTEVDEVYVVLILVGVLFMGFITDFTGSSIIYGPLILGYVIPDGPPLGSILVEKTECFVSEILLPLFFLRVGFELDLCSIQNWRVSLIFMFILFMGYFAKFLGVFLASLAFKLRPTYAFVLGLLMNSKGIVEMIVYFRLKKVHYIDEPTFAVLVFSSLAITSIIAPLTEMLYKPEIPLDSSKKYRRLKTIHTTPRTSELRVISCVHNEENVHSLINLLEASNPTELSPICAYVIHLVELTGRTAPLLIPYNAKMKRVSKLTSSAGSESHFALALDKQTPLIIVPYHENLRHIQGNRVATSIRAFNTNLQMHAPCTVGILVDRGSRHMNSSQFSYNVVVIFIGGEDDRQALGKKLRARKNTKASVKAKAREKAITIAITIGQGQKIKTKEVDEEMEMLMDEVLYDEFKIKNLGNACVACREVEAENSAQVMDAIRSLDKNYDLVMVGLNRHQALELGDIEMPHNDAKNIEDLGMIGDVLVLSDFSMGWLSLLVLHHCGAPNHVRT
uniref:Cation/H+ exchanger transmembrane domain-containing protein n=1 Tax=Fagus sylvatica TaxID=28930 RepID=A0A2N9GI63_FAGSY